MQSLKPVYLQRLALARHNGLEEVIMDQYGSYATQSTPITHNSVLLLNSKLCLILHMIT